MSERKKAIYMPVNVTPVVLVERNKDGDLSFGALGADQSMSMGLLGKPDLTTDTESPIALTLKAHSDRAATGFAQSKTLAQAGNHGASLERNRL